MRPAGLNEDITYWGPGQENQFGVRTHNSPILIKGRWQNIEQEVGVLGGNVIKSHAYVYVNVDLGINGFLAQGDHTDQPEPVVVPGAFEILDYHEDSDLRSCGKLRRAIL